MYNKNRYNKINDRKIMHKVHKHWVTVSVALLGLLGTGVVTTHVSANSINTNDNTPTVKSNINTNTNTNNSLISSSQNNSQTNLSNNYQRSNQNITNQANSLHSSILRRNANSLSNGILTSPHSPSSTSSNSLNGVILGNDYSQLLRDYNKISDDENLPQYSNYRSTFNNDLSSTGSALNYVNSLEAFSDYSTSNSAQSMMQEGKAASSNINSIIDNPNNIKPNSFSGNIPSSSNNNYAPNSNNVSLSNSASISASLSNSILSSANALLSNSNSASISTSISLSNSASISASLSNSILSSTSASLNNSNSASISTSISLSNSASISASLSNSILSSTSASLNNSASVSTSTSTSLSNSASISASLSNSILSSTSASLNNSNSASISTSISLSNSASISASLSNSILASTNASLNSSASVSTSTSISLSNSASLAHNMYVIQSAEAVIKNDTSILNSYNGIVANDLNNSDIKADSEGDNEIHNDQNSLNLIDTRTTSLEKGLNSSNVSVTEKSANDDIGVAKSIMNNVSSAMKASSDKMASDKKQAMLSMASQVSYNYKQAQDNKTNLNEELNKQDDKEFLQNSPVLKSEVSLATSGMNGTIANLDNYTHSQSLDNNLTSEANYDADRVKDAVATVQGIINLNKIEFYQTSVLTKELMHNSFKVNPNSKEGNLVEQYINNNEIPNGNILGCKIDSCVLPKLPTTLGKNTSVKINDNGDVTIDNGHVTYTIIPLQSIENSMKQGTVNNRAMNLENVNNGDIYTTAIPRMLGETENNNDIFNIISPGFINTGLKGVDCVSISTGDHNELDKVKGSYTNADILANSINLSNVAWNEYKHPNSDNSINLVKQLSNMGISVSNLTKNEDLSASFNLVKLGMDYRELHEHPNNREYQINAAEQTSETISSFANIMGKSPAMEFVGRSAGLIGDSIGLVDDIYQEHKNPNMQNGVNLALQIGKTGIDILGPKNVSSLTSSLRSEIADALQDDTLDSVSPSEFADMSIDDVDTGFGLLLETQLFNQYYNFINNMSSSIFNKIDDMFNNNSNNNSNNKPLSPNQILDLYAFCVVSQDK